MKKTILPLSILVVGAAAMVSMNILSDNGKAGFTGSPGENLCTNCHNTYTLNSGGGSISLSSNPAFVNSCYVPGTTYTMSATVSRTGNNLFGIGLEALNSTNNNAGTLAITNTAETRTVSVTVGGTSRKNVVHQLNGGASANSKTFNFNWTAPTTGSVTFYAAGVAANSSGTTAGDYVYNTSLALTGPMVGIDEASSVIQELSIFPNPAVEKINLKYTLLKTSEVKIDLYAMQGNKVSSLLSESQVRGTIQKEIPLPADIKSGCYLLRMSVNGNVIDKTIIIE